MAYLNSPCSEGGNNDNLKKELAAASTYEEKFNVFGRALQGLQFHAVEKVEATPAESEPEESRTHFLDAQISFLNALNVFPQKVSFEEWGEGEERMGSPIPEDSYHPGASFIPSHPIDNPFINEMINNQAEEAREQITEDADFEIIEEEPENFECANTLGGVPAYRCEKECLVCREGRLEAAKNKRKPYAGGIWPDERKAPQTVKDAISQMFEERTGVTFNCDAQKTGGVRCVYQCEDCKAAESELIGNRFTLEEFKALWNEDKIIFSCFEQKFFIKGETLPVGTAEEVAVLIANTPLSMEEKAKFLLVGFGAQLKADFLLNKPWEFNDKETKFSNGSELKFVSMDFNSEEPKTVVSIVNEYEPSEEDIFKCFKSEVGALRCSFQCTECKEAEVEASGTDLEARLRCFNSPGSLTPMPPRDNGNLG